MHCILEWFLQKNDNDNTILFILPTVSFVIWDIFQFIELSLLYFDVVA